ncbi:MAG: glutamate--cysteine ligase [Candidatus Sedimenticola sp. (ex Thyasira tokunagai)]
MYRSIENRLRQLSNEALQALKGGAIGLEKECLRVSPDGGIAQTEHPKTLGAALSNGYITTDYSEALAELITPPMADGGEALAFLGDLQKFAYDRLDDEILWATSMPCVLAGGENIPIARYGDSNAGTMKTVYRRGLGHRYGRTMQVIAGVHFNFSLEESLWPLLRELEGDKRSLRCFTDDAYLGMTRNLQRFGWLIPYLFGASPAVCKSFLGGKNSSLDSFDEYTYYEPYATSLRMGDIGYTNSKEQGVGVKADYNSLEGYIDSLTCAIETPSPIWREIGVKVDGRYEQLNANVLQIENEYYSTVRPKQVLKGLEKPTLALKARGVRYIELRSLDVNAFHPLGMSEEQLSFLRAFMLFCLLLESPPIDSRERGEIDRNIIDTAHRGRDSALTLLRQGKEVLLSEWATEICAAMVPLCELLDGDDPQRPHGRALAEQLACVGDPGLTPSARMLAEMRSRDEGFFHFAWRMSLQHRDYFRNLQLSREREALFLEEAEASLLQQAAIEAADKISFDQFLADYFA